MKKIKILVILLGLGFLAVMYFQRPEKETERPLTEVRLDKKVINMGDRSINDSSVVYFKIENTGENPLFITGMTTDCHCTAVVPESDSVGPGEIMTLRAEYDNNAVGFFNQAITVYMNTLSSPELLIIRGRITP